MPTYIALLRAVNVGRRQIKMADLRDCLSEAGYLDVQTHIQTGNVRVSTPMRSTAKLESALEQTIEEQFGFEVPTLVRTPAELEEVVAAGAQLTSPVPGEPRRFVNFMRTAPSAEVVEQLHAWESPGERVIVLGRELPYFSTVLFDKSKFDKSPLAKQLSPITTSRNWKVVNTLAGKWGQSSAT